MDSSTSEVTRPGVSVAPPIPPGFELEAPAPSPAPVQSASPAIPPGFELEGAQPAQPLQPYAAPPAMPHPDAAFAQIDANAKLGADFFAARANAPPVPPLHFPQPLRTAQNSPWLQDNPGPTFNEAIGRPPGQGFGFDAATGLDPTGIVPGIVRAARGVGQVATGPDTRGRVIGAREALAGGFDAATVGMVGGAFKSPLKTAVSLAGGMATQAGIEAGLKRLGMPQHWAGLAGDFAGIIAGVGTHEAMSPKAVAAIKAKYEPILKARAEKAAAKGEPSTANTTGTEPYRPGSTAVEVSTPAPAKPVAPPAQRAAALPAPSPPKEKPNAQTQSEAPRAPAVEAAPAGPALVAPAGGGEPAAKGGEVKNPTGAPVARTIEQPGANDGKHPPDAGKSGEGSALYGTSPSGSRRLIGKKTNVLIPGERRSIPAHYEVRELDDSNASHNGETFLPNPKYGLKNERDYSQPENQQRVIENSSEENFEPAYHLNNSPTMADGPTLLSEDSHAIAGNQRRMQLERVYGRGGARAHAYRQMLQDEAHVFGIDATGMAGMKKPGLFRVIEPGALDDIPGGSKWAIRKTNVSGTAALSSSERAAADAGQMSPEMTSHIAGAIEEAGADATLNDALTGKSGTVIVNRLIADGFFSEQERPALMDGKTGVLTQHAKDRIGKAMLGQFFRDSDQIARTPASIRNKLERVAAPLAKVAGNAEWDIAPDVREAIDLIEYAGAHGVRNLGDVVSQSSMFGEGPKWSDGAVKLAEMLRDGKPNDAVSAFRRYVNSKDAGSMFGESTPGEAFADAFGAEKPIRAPESTTPASPAPGVLERLSAAGKESEQWLRDNGIGGGSLSANRILDPQVLFHLTRAVAGDVARGAITVRAAAQGVLDRIRDKFDDVPAFAVIEARIREHVDATREVGERGPVFRNFRHDEAGATAALKQAESGDAIAALRIPSRFAKYGDPDLVWGRPGDGPPDWKRGSGLSHILAKHPEIEGHLQEMLDRMTMETPHGPERVELSNPDGERAVLALTWYGRETKTWLLTEYEGKVPAIRGILDGSEGPPGGRGGPTSPPTGNSSVTLGSGLGAFEPFLRESYEDMKALKAKRDAAIEELERSKITTGEKRWGEQVRHYFTGERDVWAARANQGIAKVRKLTVPSRNRRTRVDTMAEAIAIAREFKGNPAELRSILDGSHPDYAALKGPDDFTRVMDRIQALRPSIERALQPMDAEMKAVDQFYTNMAEMTGAEGKRVGNLDATWNPETYVPHVLNPKGEGALPGARKAIGQALGGRIGKYFGFSQQRNYPTLLHAIMANVIPKTMDIHNAFTVQQDSFATSRATRLLEDQLRDTNIGKYTVKANAPEGSVPLAPQSNEFRQSIAYDTGTIDEQGQPVLDTAEKRLFVPKFIAEALKPITSPDFTTEIVAVHALRVTQAATKAAQLGLSFFHATTENYMALANMGVKGFVRALRADRDSAEFLVAERDLIAHGGTTSIQGNTVEAYRAMQPGSIPTYGDIWRQNAAVKIMDQAAGAISDFTFANMQRRFKVTDYQLHTAEWMAKNPQAWGRDLTMAKQGIAKEINAIYGGLHWENIGANKASVEIARAIMLAPDWTLSNIFNVKYVFEKGPGGQMARMFWVRTLLGGVAATQAASLMFSGKPSKRPTMVYMGHDSNGREIYQNIFFKGAPGDVTNLVTNVMDYGLQGIARTIFAKGAPVVRTVLQIEQNRDYLGHEIAPKGMNPLASTARTAWAAGKSMLPVPLSLTNQADMLFGPESHKYKLAESLTTMFSGNPPSHVAPAGTHMSGGVLRPNAPREENSALEQAETGQVYKRRAR